MAFGDIPVLNHFPNTNNFPDEVHRTMVFIDKNSNGIDDRDESKPPSVVYLPYPMPQPGMENQTEGFNVGRFAGAVAPIIAGLFGGGLSSGAPDFTTPYDDYLNPNRQHTFGDFGPDGNPVGFSPEDIKELNELYPNPYEQSTV